MKTGIKQMDIRRTLLYVAIAAVIAILWSQWQKEHPKVEPTTVQTQQQQPVKSTGADQASRFVPSATSVETSKASAPGTHSHASTDSSSLVSVKTNVIHALIDLKTGDLVQASLPEYSISLQQPDTPVQILSRDKGAQYQLQSGIIDSDSQPPKITFITDKSSYVLQSGDDTLTVILRGKSGELLVEKQYEFSRDSYHATLTTTVTNQGSKPWKGQWYQQIMRQNVPSSTHHIRSYDGAAISSPKTPYKKISFSDMDKSAINQSITDGWVAMQQPYFVTAWVPPKKQPYQYYSHVASTGTGSADLYTIGFMSQPWTINAGKQQQQISQLYIGPEIAKDLNPVAPALKLTIDYGFLSPVSSVIFTVMNTIHRVVGNWGWSIILVTLLIKLLFYWPSAQSYKSMAKMRKVQPRLMALKERFGDDKAALSKATMEFYRKEKVNPMGGCLPMIIQIPVFFALYYVLIESVELRQAPFILWIHDLSVKDPYYVLPILMGLSMFLQQRLSPAPPDPTQAKMMMLMPVVFTVVFLSFPAGLVLYWLTNNLLSIGQQWYVMNSVDKKKK